MSIAKLLGSVLLASLMMSSVAQASSSLCLIAITNCETKTYSNYSRGNQFEQDTNEQRVYLMVIEAIGANRKQTTFDFADVQSCENSKKSFEQTYARCQ
jgi:hypothetical protein